MKKIQLTYSSPFQTVHIKIWRSSGNKKFIDGREIKGSGKASLELNDDPKYKGNYDVHFFDLLNNPLTIIRDVEPVSQPY